MIIRLLIIIIIVINSNNSSSNNNNVRQYNVGHGCYTIYQAGLFFWFPLKQSQGSLGTGSTGNFCSLDNCAARLRTSLKWQGTNRNLSNRNGELPRNHQHLESMRKNAKEIVYCHVESMLMETKVWKSSIARAICASSENESWAISESNVDDLEKEFMFPKAPVLIVQHVRPNPSSMVGSLDRSKHAILDG